MSLRCDYANCKNGLTGSLIAPKIFVTEDERNDMNVRVFEKKIIVKLDNGVSRKLVLCIRPSFLSKIKFLTCVRSLYTNS